MAPWLCHSQDAALASSPAGQGMQWVTAAAGATFCIVAKLPAKAPSAQQVLFDFAPVFKLSRSSLTSASCVVAGQL
jgi:hypothetical protein